MKLWEVSDKVEVILAECVDRETGEIEPEAEKQLDDLQLERRKLIFEIARYIKGEHAEALAILNEADKLVKRAKSHQSRARWLEGYLEKHVYTTEKYEDPTVKVHWKQSTAVKLEWPTETDHAHVDPYYVKVKEVRSVDKAKALPVLREGTRIRGLVLEQRSKLKVD